MRVTVNFSLKKSKSRADGKCPVYVRCTMNNQRFELSTSIFICPESWNDERQQVAGRSEETKILNNRLYKIRTRAQDVYNQTESKGDMIVCAHCELLPNDLEYITRSLSAINTFPAKTFESASRLQ